MSAGHELGRRGEQIAARFLVRLGWQILARNVRFGRREIDLIVRREETVAFVEVKARAGAGYGHPLAAITAAKRREIERVARWWIARHGQARDVYRFDAIAITRSGSALRVEHVEDAWRL